MNKKNETKSNVGSDLRVIVFGSQRIGAIYAHRNGIDVRRIKLATSGVEALRGVSGSIDVVRVSEEVWKPTTRPCEHRVHEVEQALKALGEKGVSIRNVVLA